MVKERSMRRYMSTGTESAGETVMSSSARSPGGEGGGGGGDKWGIVHHVYTYTLHVQFRDRIVIML